MVISGNDKKTFVSWLPHFPDAQIQAAQTGGGGGQLAIGGNTKRVYNYFVLLFFGGGGGAKRNFAMGPSKRWASCSNMMLFRICAP